MHCCCSFSYAGKRSLNISLMKVHAAIIYLLSILVILCGIALAPDAHPTKWFDEKQTVTAYSALLLYTCAFVSGLNYLTCRTLSHVDPIRRSLKSLWALAIPGFGFLMADEFFVMHEGIGRFLAYRVLRLTVSSFADHFDGFVILAYGLVGLAALLYYFRELKQVPCFFNLPSSGCDLRGYIRCSRSSYRLGLEHLYGRRSQSAGECFVSLSVHFLDDTRLPRITLAY
jgi:hypothetical protein